MARRAWCVVRRGLLLAVAAVIMIAAAAPAAVPDDPQLGESTLGNLVADAVRRAGGADLALVTAVSLSDNAAVPAATPDAAHAALRYPGDLVLVVELTGAQIRDALEFGLSQLPRPHKGLLQVSGITVVYDSSKPINQRVASVTVGRAALVAEQKYQVAMPSSLARGALGYFRVWSQPAARDAGVTMADALLNYLRAGAPAARRDGRLRDTASPG